MSELSTLQHLRSQSQTWIRFPEQYPFLASCQPKHGVLLLKYMAQAHVTNHFSLIVQLFSLSLPESRENCACMQTGDIQIPRQESSA